MSDTTPTQGAPSTDPTPAASAEPAGPEASATSPAAELAREAPRSVKLPTRGDRPDPARGAREAEAAAKEAAKAEKPAEAKPPAKGKAEAPAKGKDAEEGKELEAAAAAGEAGKGAEIADSAEFEIEGEKVTLQDLKEGYRQIQQAAAKFQEAKQLQDQARRALTAIIEPGKDGGPAKVSVDGLLDLLTRANRGNRDAAYQELVEASCKVVSQHLEWEEMSPEAKEGQRAKWELRETKRRLEEHERRIAEERRSARSAKLMEENYGKIKAAAKAAGLPEKESLYSKVADVLVKAIESGFPITHEKAAQAVKKEYDRLRTEFFSAAEPDEIPAELVEKIRKRDLEQVKDRKYEHLGAKTPNEAEPRGRMVRLPTRMRT